MNILFIETDILTREKLLKLLSYKKDENNSYLVASNDSKFAANDILKELEIGEEIIEEVNASGPIQKIIFILNENVPKINKVNQPLNFDFLKSGNLNYKNFNINLDYQEVFINNKRIRLTSFEYNLLLLFIYNAKKIIPKNEMMDYMWGKDKKPLASTPTMYTHIKNLKKKIIESGVGNFIHSIYGQGYKFEEPEEIIL